MYNDLSTQLLEMTFADLVKKQKSVVRLFPTQKDREKKVAGNGGAKLTGVERGLFTFTVASGDPARHAAGVTYITHVQFNGVEQALERAASDKRNWTRDGRHLNLNALGRVVIYDTDLKVSCNCQASQYWGFNYIKTKTDTEYNYPEDRSPDIRNPSQYGITCKHFGWILDVLPFYTATAGGMLKKFYRDFIVDLEKKALHAEYNPEHRAEVTNTEPEAEEQGPRVPQEEPEDEEENPDQKIGL